MRKVEAIAELLRIKGMLQDALLDEIARFGKNVNEDAFFKQIRNIWKEMDNAEYLCK